MSLKGSIYRMYREQYQAKANPSFTHARRCGIRFGTIGCFVSIVTPMCAAARGAGRVECKTA
jgi:hypothetical protein